MILDVDPTVDFVFKKVFGIPDHQDILADLLNSILKLPRGRLITTLDYLNPFSDRDTPDDKLAIVDVRVRDQSRRQHQIEMQMRSSWYFPSRIVYHWAKFHQEQMKEGDHYQTLRPTICIWFVNDAMFPDLQAHHLEFGIWDRTHQVLLSKDLAIHVFPLKHFTKSLADITTRLDGWLWFFRYAATLDPASLPEAMQRPALLRAVEVLRVISQDELERQRYEDRRKAERDHASFLYEVENSGKRGLRRGLQRGLKLGLKRGRQKGLEQGLEKGLEKGLEQGLEKGLEKGLEQGLLRGELLGFIKSYKEFLGMPSTPASELAQKSIPELQAMADALRARLQHRSP